MKEYKLKNDREVFKRMRSFQGKSGERLMLFLPLYSPLILGDSGGCETLFVKNIIGDVGTVKSEKHYHLAAYHEQCNC